MLKTPKKIKERKKTTDDLGEILSKQSESKIIDSPTKLTKALGLPIDTARSHQLYHKLLKDLGQDKLQNYVVFIKGEFNTVQSYVNSITANGQLFMNTFEGLLTFYQAIISLYKIYTIDVHEYKARVGILEHWEVKYMDMEKRLQDTININKKAGELLTEKNTEIKRLMRERDTYNLAYKRASTFARQYLVTYRVNWTHFIEYAMGVREKEDIEGLPEYLEDMFDDSGDL